MFIRFLVSIHLSLLELKNGTESGGNFKCSQIAANVGNFDSCPLEERKVEMKNLK